MYKKLLMVSVVFLLLGLVGIQSTQASTVCPVGQAAVNSRYGAMLRPTPAQSGLVGKLTYQELVTVLDCVEGTKATVAGVSSTTWAHITTKGGLTGYVSALLLGTPVSQDQPVQQGPTTPPQPVQGGGFQSAGIFASLNVTVYSAETYTGRRLSVPKLMTLTGRQGIFDGGTYPFDDFLYDAPWSSNGYYYSEVILHTSGTPEDKHAYAWKQHGREDVLLVWVYHDLYFTDNQKNPCAPGSGNGCGQHHFSWWGAVSKADWDRGTGTR